MSQSIYNSTFYDKQSQDSYSSALIIIKQVLDEFKEVKNFQSAVDLGCGVGSWLAAAKKLGFREVIGTDGDYVPKDRLMIENAEFISNDLSDPLSVSLPIKRFDLAMSLEVAEHIPQASADKFIDKLTSLSDIVLFSAAIPYQGGHGHINENWPEYWQQKFEKKGYYALDLIRDKVWANDDVCWWYRQNVFIYTNIKNSPRVNEYNRNKNLSRVHPKQFLTAVHREKTQRFYSLKQDNIYWKNLISGQEVEVLSYGEEYSYTENSDVEVDSIVELEQVSGYEKSRLRSLLSPLVLSGQVKLASQSQKCLKHYPDYLIIGDIERHRKIDALPLNETGLWFCDIYGLGFFNSYYLEPKSAFYDNKRRMHAFDKLRKVLGVKTVLEDSWLLNLVSLTKSKVNLDWYSSVFERPWITNKLAEIELDYLYLSEEVISIIRTKMPSTKIIILKENSSFEEKISALSQEISVTFTVGLIAQLQSNIYLKEYFNFEKQCGKWIHVFGKDNVSIINFTELDDLKTSFGERMIG